MTENKPIKMAVYVPKDCESADMMVKTFQRIANGLGAEVMVSSDLEDITSGKYGLVVDASPAVRYRGMKSILPGQKDAGTRQFFVEYLNDPLNMTEELTDKIQRWMQ